LSVVAFMDCHNSWCIGVSLETDYKDLTKSPYQGLHLQSQGQDQGLDPQGQDQDEVLKFCP